MRGVKDEEKVMSPIFPRLHVNDTEKGGPKAPPRNKMALYEQLSIPSQSFTFGSPSLSLPHNNSSSLVPSTSLSDVVADERNILTPSCNSLVPSHPAEEIQSYTPSGAKLNTMMADYERISTKPSNYQSFNAIGPSSSAAKCDSFQPNKISNFRNFSLKFGNGDDVRVPTSFLGIALQCTNSQQSKEREKLPCLISTVQLKSSCMNASSTIDLKSRQYVRNQDEENPRVSQDNEDTVERSVSIALASVKDFSNTSSCPSNKVKNSESLKRTYVSMSQENRSSSMNDSTKLGGSNAQLHRESLTVRDRVALKEDILVESRIGKVEISSKVRIESCLKPSLGNDNRIPNGLKNGSECCEENCGVVGVGNLDRHENISDMPMVDYISALDISPDDVVGVLGAEQFCKTRKAIANQQRVFAVQVFELHRLIKVQRFIAGSPNLLHEGKLFLSKPAVKVPLEHAPLKKVPLEHALEPPSLSVKPKDHPQKPNSSTECSVESAAGNFPLPCFNNDTSRGLVTKQSNYGQYSKNAPLASGATNSKPPLWCFQPPPGNMWLVPIMSPTEGLAYKPYTGPCPPAGGFMAPMYGSCGPVSLNPGNRDYLNAAYGVPASYQQGMGAGRPPLLQTFFPPYGLPLTNPTVSSSAVEKMTPFSGGHSNGQEINFTMPHQSPCNMSSQLRQEMSCCVENIQANSKESELQGSTASIPSDWTKGNMLPLFPMAPQVQEPTQNAQTSEHQTPVIKVVPHNIRSATESAARIFLSIQEERRNCS